MNNLSFSISVPGSLMLLGEHAVLHNKLCLVGAVNQRLTVNFSPRSDQTIIIHSTLGNYSASLNHLIEDQRFKFVLTAIQLHQSLLSQGFELTITSEFSDKIGFGSSAAVSAATCAALHYYLTHNLDLSLILNLARQVIWQVQGAGSGADAAASIYGGIVAYRMEPFYLKKLNNFPLLTAIYSGSKTPTPQVIAKVNEAMAKKPDFYKNIFNEMEKCSVMGENAINEKNWQSLSLAFKEQQFFLDKLGVNTANLQTIINKLQQQPEILAAKISGAGLGDCIIGLGQLTHEIFPENADQLACGIKQIPISITASGLCLHE